jgi:hypothetical protein
MSPFFKVKRRGNSHGPAYMRIYPESQLTLHLQRLLTSQDSESKDYWSDNISKPQASAASPDLPAF